MLYKLIIADDEERIRDGLRDLIPWQQLGFEVVKICSDGQEIIDYINQNEVHAVFSDIKMPIIGGIEVAKYIYENKLSIKVVLISAYNDFSLAKKAIEFNVSNYILKPTRLPDIRKIFKKVKYEIDALLSDEYKKLELKESSDRIDMLLRRQFFSDIYYGAIKSEDDINKRFNLIDLDFDPKKNLCCIFSIYANNSLASNNNIKDIRNFINSTRIANVNSSSTTMNFYPIHQGNKKITYMAIELSKSQNWNKDKMLNSIYYHFNDLIEQIKAVFNINMHIEVHEMHSSLYEFMEQINISSSPTSQKINRKIQYSDMELLDGRISSLVSHVRSDELDLAENLFSKLYEQIGNNPILLKSICIGIFISINPDGLDTNSKLTYSTINKIIQITEIDELANILKNIIHCKECYNPKSPKSTKRDIVGITKHYIENNFTKDIFLDSAAENANISPAYLSRIFKKSTAVNFTQYVTNVRLEKATEYLINYEYNIYDISKFVGYSNIYYFYRIFKNKFGCTPSEYRKEHTNEA